MIMVAQAQTRMNPAPSPVTMPVPLLAPRVWCEPHKCDMSECGCRAVQSRALTVARGLLGGAFDWVVTDVSSDLDVLSGCCRCPRFMDGKGADMSRRVRAYMQAEFDRTRKIIADLDLADPEHTARSPQEKARHRARVWYKGNRVRKIAYLKEWRQKRKTGAGGAQ